MKNESILAIPILEGYKLIDAETGALFIAKSDDNSIEQYIEEGKLGEDETFDERLKSILVKTKNILGMTGFEEKDLTFHSDYSSSILNFKIYIQDNTREEITIKQMNAYFIEPTTNYFYQITLSAPPLHTKDINDNVIENIYYRLKIIMDNIKYNKKES